MPPIDIWGSVERKAEETYGFSVWDLDTTFPALVLIHRPYNSCTLPGDYQIDWQMGKVLVYVHQLVGFPEDGCPSGPNDLIVQYVPLDMLENGDEIFVNDKFWFIATDAVCTDYRYENCPIGCQKRCVMSCPGGGAACTADCNGKGSCLKPIPGYRHSP